MPQARPIAALAVALFLLAFALLRGPPAAQAAPARPPGEALAERLIAALNAQDPAARVRFATDDSAPGTPPQQRAERMGGLADRGAPFKVVRFNGATATSVRLLVEDGHGMRLGFILDLAGAPEAPKLAALRVGPPELLDEKAPKDHGGWGDPGALAAAIASDSESPAIGLAIVRDGKSEVVVSGLRERGGKDAVGPDEPWSIGSIGKPLCSSVIGRLIESGQLRFGTTLREALPGTPMKPAYEAVTLEQLMHHRGGVPEDPGMRRPQVEALVGSETDAAKIRERYARDILSREPIAKAGERFAYSNAGYALLAHVAERRTGKPYEQLVRELVFAPLGLAHSYAGTASLPAARPSGHVSGPEGLRPMNMTGPIEILFAGAGGGIWMSVGDLARFGAAHLAGLRGEDGFLKAATVARLHQVEPEPGPRGDRYAAGWGVHAEKGLETWHGHNGSNGTFRAELAIFPQAKLVVAAVVNRGGEGDPSPPLQAVLAVAKRYAPAPGAAGAP